MKYLDWVIKICDIVMVVCANMVRFGLICIIVNSTLHILNQESNLLFDISVWLLYIITYRRK